MNSAARWITVMCFVTLAVAEAVDLVFEDTSRRVRLVNGAERRNVDDASGGTAARTGGSWGIRWYMEADRLRPDCFYELYLRCRGEFSVALYNRQDGYRIGFREVAAAPKGGWETVYLGTMQLNSDDYLAFNGKKGSEGWIDQLILREHPRTLEERALLGSSLPSLYGDVSSPAELTFSGEFREPVRFRFRRTAEATIEIHCRNRRGKEQVYPLTKSGGIVELPASDSSPVERISFRITPHRGSRAELIAVLENPISERCLVLNSEQKGNFRRSFDQIVLSATLRRAMTQSAYLVARRNFFSIAPGIRYGFVPVSSLRKIFQELIPSGISPQSATPVELSMARNEYENFQILVIPGQGTDNEELFLRWTPDEADNPLTVQFRELG